METELTDRLGRFWPLQLLQRVRDLPVPLPCNGKAPSANAQWKNRSNEPCPHRQFVHSAPPELGVQLTKE
jgi:hypothetical protein